MAQNLIATFDLLTNRNVSYAAGDQVKVFWNDTTEQIEVELDTVSQTSGPDFGFENTDYILTTTGYQFCSGTTRHYFIVIDNPGFPYVERRSETNSSFCTASVSDLTLVSTSKTDTFSGGSDGTITATAQTSTAFSPIEFSLSSDFSTVTGTDLGTIGGNDVYEGVFTGLPAGQYFVYIRDTAGGNIRSGKIAITNDGDELDLRVNITNVTGTNPTTNGGTDGSITVTATGGTATGGAGALEYRYTLNGTSTAYQSSNTFSGLAEGDYTIRARDSSNPNLYLDDASYSLTDAPVCDLNYDIAATSPTSAGAADGTITISNQTSSNGSIETSLGPFTVPYGSGSLTTSFTNLTAGFYPIYLRDSVCEKVTGYSLSDGDNVTNVNYKALYRLEWQDLAGNRHRFIIKERGYTGATTDLDTIGGTPLVYNKPEPDQRDIFSPVHGSSVDVQVVSDTDFKFRDLYTADQSKYLGQWEIQESGNYNVKWYGFLVPEVFREPYIQTPYITTLTFADGLQLLEKTPYEISSTQGYSSEVKLSTALSNALQRVGLNLPILSAVNIYEDSHNSTAADDLFDQTYVDQTAFTVDDERKSCLEVITDIIRPFGARIIQWNGKWNIIRVKEELGTYDYRVYSNRGTLAYNASYNPIVNHDSIGETGKRVTFVGQSQGYEVVPSYRSISINNILNKKGSILDNHKFDLFYKEDGGFFANRLPEKWALKLNGVNMGDSGVRSQGGNFYYAFRTYDWNITIDNAFLEPAAKKLEWKPGDKFRFAIRIAVDNLGRAFPYITFKANIKLIPTSGTTYYLTEEGFSTDDLDFRAYPDLDDGFIEIDEEFDIPEAITSKTTYDLEVKIYPFQILNADFGEWVNSAITDGESDFRGEPTTTLPIATKRSMFANTVGFNGVSGSFFNYYVLKSGTNTESTPDTVNPDDYDAVTNKVYWELEEQVEYLDVLGDRPITSYFNKFFYIDDVVIEVLPSGDDTPEENNITVNLTEQNREDLEIDIYLGDLPDPADRDISSARYQYNNHFRLSDGSPTLDWARDGVNELDTIQKVLLKQYGQQYGSPTSRLTGDFTGYNPDGTSLILSPLNTIKETQDANKGYYISGMSYDAKNMLSRVELIQLKGTAGDSPEDGTDTGDGDSGDGGGGISFSGGFTSGFGSGFEVTF